MKRIAYIITVFVMVAAGMHPLNAQSRQEKKEKRQSEYQETEALVRGGAFIFEAKRAFPRGGRSIDLTTNYGFIRISDSNAEGDLPFFGRAYSIEYGGGGGIEFKGPMEEVELKANDKKMTLRYRFEVSDKDVYKVSMDIGYSGNATVTVTSNNRSTISYNGEISAIL